MFVLLMVPHHGGSGRATVSSRTRREAQHVLVEVRAERIRLVSATHKAAEPEVEFDEREEELVRG